MNFFAHGIILLQKKNLSNTFEKTNIKLLQVETFCKACLTCIIKYNICTRRCNLVFVLKIFLFLKQFFIIFFFFQCSASDSILIAYLSARSKAISKKNVTDPNNMVAYFSEEVFYFYFHYGTFKVQLLFKKFI